MSEAHIPIEQATVSEALDGVFIDQASCALLRGLPSKSSARKAVKLGLLRVDGAEVAYDKRVKAGQVLTLAAGEATGAVTDVALDVVYEDDALAIVNKPAGMPTVGWGRKTLVAALPTNLLVSPRLDVLPRPHPVHRIDARTRGAVLVAKTGAAAAHLSAQLRERTLKKRYTAVVCGRLEGEGRCEEPLDDKAAATRWRVVSHSRALGVEWFTTVEAWPETGRMHQIRRHLATLGHPVAGDVRYAGDVTTSGRRGLLLQARGVEFAHPDDERTVVVELAEDPKFERFRERERARWARVFEG